MGVNYSPQTYDRFHNGHPKMPMFGSETASTVTTRGEYADDRAKSFVTSYNMTDGSWLPGGRAGLHGGQLRLDGF